jgi:phosphate acetyltransferase
MSKIINEIKKTIKNSNIKPIIVFPEGHNKFIEKAAINLKNNSKILPLLVVKKDSKIKNNGLKYISIESFEHKENLIENLYQIRKSKGLSKKEATNLIEKSNYFATMLVKIGKAHGYVGGIEYTTADTLRPALQIIKTNPNSKIVSSLFIMEKNEEQFLFADCAINLNPNIEQIVEITKQVNNFGLNIVKMNEVRNALLSYSTAGSAKGEDAIKMEKAYEILKKEDLKNQKVFGSIQFDAAFVKSIMNKKAPNLK